MKENTERKMRKLKTRMKCGRRNIKVDTTEMLTSFSIYLPLQRRVRVKNKEIDYSDLVMVVTVSLPNIGV